MDLHVAKGGSDTQPGTEAAPFASISAAARRARPGDTVIVHGGVYREWVSPPRGGLSDARRITFTAAEGEHVVITGSEIVADWEETEPGLWRAEVDNAVFQGSNPFAEELAGDWLVRPDDDEPVLHLGEVYLDGQALLEVGSLDLVRHPPTHEFLLDDWTGVEQPAGPRPLVWHAEVGDTHTVIHANFAAADPREALVEINVRRSIFYPSEPHVDYITVRGFEMRHAATPWAPPTADQPGMVGPNWAKGWIIEDNVLHDAKCAAVSLGKNASTGHNAASERRDKPGYQYQLEAVFTAREYGWSREHIGSHVVRRNTIYDCGQNAIVGNLGCVFSTISDNHIHRIGVRRQFYGHEIAGIKLHAPIDVSIVGNHIHDCSLGLWLDWQTQGTRISHNVLHSNSRDLFIEVSHGPYVVDNNVLASPVSLENFSQGGAYIANLFLGLVRIETVLDRATPYHLPHSTAVAGYAFIVGGDDRFILNVFGGDPSRVGYRVDLPEVATAGYGTAVYDGHPASFEEYLERTSVRKGDHRRFAGVLQAVIARDNVYLGAARAFDGETGPVRLEEGGIQVDWDGHVVTLRPEPSSDARRSGTVTGGELGRARLVDADFDDLDGRALALRIDETSPVGRLAPGSEPVVVWPRPEARQRAT